jgi:hypothetical protein
MENWYQFSAWKSDRMKIALFSGHIPPSVQPLFMFFTYGSLSWALETMRVSCCFIFCYESGVVVSGGGAFVSCLSKRLEL